MSQIRSTVPPRVRPAHLVIAALALASVTAPSIALAQTAATPPSVPSIQMQRLPNGRVVIEATDRGVTIRKEITGATSHVLITTPSDELQIRTSSAGLTLSAPAGSATLGTDPSSAEEWLALLRGSTAAADARALLRRLPVTPGQIGYQALLLTRAVLDIGTGTREALREWAHARPQAHGGVQVIKTAQNSKTDRTASECIEQYSIDAIKVYKEYEACLEDAKWWELHKEAICVGLYAFQAELLMAWVIRCVGGYPFAG